MRLFKSLWQKWKTIAHKLGIFQSKVILTFFYFLLTPFGIFFSLFKDELKIKKVHSSTWIEKTNQSGSLSELQKQY